MAGFTTSATLSEMINKFQIKKRRKSGKKKEKEETYQKIRRQGYLKNILVV
jgi:hypothetical protein